MSGSAEEEYLLARTQNPNPLRWDWVFLILARLVVDRSRRIDFLTQFQLRSQSTEHALTSKTVNAER